MTAWYRPLVQHGPARPSGAVPLAGGPLWFTHAETITRAGRGDLVAARNLPPQWLDRLGAPRAALAGLDLHRPQVMGIVNVTPDSFSDPGALFDPTLATNAALAMLAAGASIVDIGGESTRPGAAEVPQTVEIGRVAPVIAAIRAQSGAPVSVDTRKLAVAHVAVGAGATLVNDVSGLTFDPGLAAYCVAQDLPVCVMHMRGQPATMQDAPTYENVLLDVYDHLDARLGALESLGLPRHRILVDPGIGFAKTLDHNLAILRDLALFHGLGSAILLGVSRKRFVGTLSGVTDPARRAPGSIAAGLAALAQGVQILRVHDVAETVQAVRLWQAVRG